MPYIDMVVHTISKLELNAVSYMIIGLHECSAKWLITSGLQLFRV